LAIIFHAVIQMNGHWSFQVLNKSLTITIKVVYTKCSLNSILSYFTQYVLCDKQSEIWVVVHWKFIWETADSEWIVFWA